MIGRIQRRDIAAPGAALQAATPAMGDREQITSDPNNRRGLRLARPELSRRNIVDRQFTRTVGRRLAHQPYEAWSVRAPFSAALLVVLLYLRFC